MTTLTADAGSFVLTGQAISPRLFADAGSFALRGQAVGFSRRYSVDLGTSLTLKLERLASVLPIVDSQGRPSPQFQRFWQKHCEAIEGAYGSLASAVVALQVAYDTAAQASAAAASANDAAAQAGAAAGQANQLIDDIQGGVLNFPTIQIGGDKFYNNAGVLEPL